jgi:hypothetical protein
MLTDACCCDETVDLVDISNKKISNTIKICDDYTVNASVLLHNGNFATACPKSINIWNERGECLQSTLFEKVSENLLYNCFANRIAEVELGVLAFQSGTKFVLWNIRTNATREIELMETAQLRCFLYE